MYSIFQNTFLGGTDTTAITLDWTMSELMANPRVMNKLQAEVRSCIGSKPRVERDDLNNLKYLKMVIKEALRKHTPIPLLIPRETMDYFKIHDKSSSREYDIYPGTRILVNAWGIGRDPKSGRTQMCFTQRGLRTVRLSFMGSTLSYCHLGVAKGFALELTWESSPQSSH